jgi:hypothetical protein
MVGNYQSSQRIGKQGLVWIEESTNLRIIRSKNQIFQISDRDYIEIFSFFNFLFIYWTRVFSIEYNSKLILWNFERDISCFMDELHFWSPTIQFSILFHVLLLFRNKIQNIE